MKIEIQYSHHFDRNKPTAIIIKKKKYLLYLSPFWFWLRRECELRQMIPMEEYTEYNTSDSVSERALER